jgi:dodecin
MGCPNDERMRSATMRPTTSVGPPAANGTTNVIGRTR